MAKLPSRKKWTTVIIDDPKNKANPHFNLNPKPKP